jgi:heme exporter protein D
MNWQEFFAMGGYGVYVWPAYGLTAVLLLVNVLEPHWRERRLLRRLGRRPEPTRRR